jgi:hypothetical protein
MRIEKSGEGLLPKDPPRTPPKNLVGGKRDAMWEEILRKSPPIPSPKPLWEGTEKREHTE